MQVAVDVDDTLAATVEQFCRRVASEHGVEIAPAALPGRDELHTATIPGTDVTYAGAIAEAVTDPSLLAAVEPLPGAAATLTDLHEAGADRIELVTRRPKVVRDTTVAWLDDHGVPYDALQCGAGSDRLGDADVLVDDQPGHVRSAAADGAGVLFLRPFNVGKRADDLPDAARLEADDPASLAADPARQWRAIGATLPSLVG